MILYDGAIFCGGGDYGSNAGPVDIWCYNIAEQSWSKSGTVPEEEVDRFFVIGGSLVIPGIDLHESWDFGNYYIFNQGEWNKVRNIPGGIHNFDMVEYDNMLFAGLGVISGEYPVVCSLDGGESFSHVKMQKGGIPIETSGSQNVRVYDFFVFNDGLYAAFIYGDTQLIYDLYRYENGVFIYDNQWYQKIYQIKYTNNIIGGKTEYKGKMFFTTGYLYVTDNMSDFLRIAFPHSETVYDLYVDNDILYILCGEKLDDGTYKTSVWKNRSGNERNFTEMFYFIYEVPPLSMVCENGNFYIGMGNTDSENEKNGMVLSVQYSSNK